jgi:hypothetical protein
MIRTIVLTILAILFTAAAADAKIACRSAPADDDHYSYRVVDGKRCWYRNEDGERRLERSDLYWRAPKIAKASSIKIDRLAQPAQPVLIKIPVRIDRLAQPTTAFPPTVEEVEAHAATMPWAAVESAYVAAPPPPPAEFDPVFVERWEPAQVAGIATGEFSQTETFVSATRDNPPQRRMPIFLLTFAWGIPALGFMGLTAVRDRRFRLDQRIPLGWVPIQLHMKPVEVLPEQGRNPT